MLIIVSLLLICISFTPALGSISHQYHVVSSPIAPFSRTMEGDIPTWYYGDEWIYKIDPLSFSSPNASFVGTIQNFKQKVGGIIGDCYKIDITGQISGQLTVNGVSGPLNGQITGNSYFRVSDLAERDTELHSQGTITIVLPLPYQLDFLTSSSPPLELYDFPLHVDEEWQVSSETSVTGSFSIQGLYEQSFNGTQWVEETVQCTQKQQISVPAGTFECYAIGRTNNPGWYSTEVRNIIKSVIDQDDENMSVHATLALQSYSFATQPIALSEDITPSVIASGVSVVISGQAIVSSSGTPVQNGAVSITIPVTGGNWATTTNSNGYYSKTITVPTITDDTPCGREIGSGGVLVECTSSSLNGYRVQTLTVIQDTPPVGPSIQGPTEGKVKTSYPYTLVATDPESDELFYYIDWGDGTNNSWIGPYPSNENVTQSHQFTKKGSYTIKMKARDVFYAESEWATLQVTMPTFVSSSFLMKLSTRFPFLYNLLQQLLR